MPDSRATVDRAEEILNRVRARTSPQAIKAQKRKFLGFMRRLKYAFFAVLGIMLAAGLFGAFVSPLGISGFFLTWVAMMITGFAILLWPSEPAPTPQAMAKADLPLLPAQTERWLEAQRPALPAPAQRLTDDIGVQLAAIAPQLRELDPLEPAAEEVRKLMAVELPELIDGYRKLPENLRRETRNGTSPDRQLVEGLKVVDEELKRMSEQLASGDLHKLATQNRYLELKYRGDGPDQTP
ncbi:hypothetical protein SAMN05444678_106228 [Sphingomonas sp. YR710]|uniref:hypothetical protein n=1 Tax=Sphingomonas sp. YR710 TaxID=1882773 RepID=UPI000887E765|nr:hypothetical protein [Sphingomonas sp. YR710]SDC89000.1 hypothetical protein SAMN05444678_106228 [Sphingomonas sp. YR710]